MIELFIENKRVDVGNAESALLTFQIDDVKNFGSKETTFSKTIYLPGTANNNALLGNIFDVKNANFYNPAEKNIGYNFNAAKSANCIIFQDNIQVFKGVLRLLEIVIDKERVEYEVAVFGELGGFVSAIGNGKLEDLDFSAYDHVYSLTNIVNSWDNAGGSGYYYPLIDYGEASVDKHNWQFHTFRPALYVKEYIDKIFEVAKYQYSCALFNTSRFKKLIIPHSEKVAGKQQTRYFDSHFDTDQTFTTQRFTDGEVHMDIEQVMNDITTVDHKTFSFTWASANVARKRRIVGVHIDNPFAGFPKTKFALNDSFGGTVVELETHYSGTPAAFDITIEDNKSWGSGTNFSLTLESFFCKITHIEAIIDPNPAGNIPMALGDDMVISRTIPKNTLQRDFFSSILKLFNLYVYEDRWSSKKLIISPFVDFYDLNPAHALDWTYKLNKDKPIRLKPLSELNARFYDFKFKSDKDYWSELYEKRYGQGYGCCQYDSEFEFANDKQEIQLIFSGTPLVGYAGEDKVYSTIYKRTGTDVSPVEERIDSNIRILQTKKITGVSSWDILNNATVLGSYTSYPYAGHFDDPDAPANDIQFGVPKELFFSLAAGAINVNQFNVYWSSYMAEITDKDSKLFTGSFRLNEMDIFTLDFSKLVYVDGCLFRLNRIEDYNATYRDESKVELLKVINTVY